MSKKAWVILRNTDGMQEVDVCGIITDDNIPDGRSAIMRHIDGDMKKLSGHTHSSFNMMGDPEECKKIMERFLEKIGCPRASHEATTQMIVSRILGGLQQR